LDLEHLELRRSKIAILIRRSKTDQDGVGRTVTIPRLSSSLCAVRAIERWLKLRGSGAGPLFAAITPHGAVTRNRLSGLAIATVVKRRVAEIGIDAAQYSGHSLRSGFVTAAARAGATTWQIKQQTGHKSDAVVAGYIRVGASTGANVARLIGR
jgi:integrase